MKGCYQTVTIWNRWRNPETKKDEFIRSVIPVLCKFKNHVSRTVDSAGVTVANSVIVIIPENEAYADALTWKNAFPEFRLSHFTIQKGDLVVLGAQSLGITGVAPNTESEIRNSLLPNAASVKAFQDNTASPNGKHYRIEGV